MRRKRGNLTTYLTTSNLPRPTPDTSIHLSFRHFRCQQCALAAKPTNKLHHNLRLTTISLPHHSATLTPDDCEHCSREVQLAVGARSAEIAVVMADANAKMVVPARGSCNGHASRQCAGSGMTNATGSARWEILARNLCSTIGMVVLGVLPCFFCKKNRQLWPCRRRIVVVKTFSIY